MLEDFTFIAYLHKSWSDLGLDTPQSRQECRLKFGSQFSAHQVLISAKHEKSRDTPECYLTDIKELKATCRRTQHVLPVSNFAQKLPTTCMQQDVHTDATCNIQQCWELLVNHVASVKVDFHWREFATHVNARKNFNHIKSAELKRWAMFNFYAHERPFMHCLYFICERNFTHVRTLKLRDIGYQPLRGGLSSKQQRQLRIPKKRIRAASILSCLFHYVQFVKYWQIFWSWIIKTVPKSRKRKRKSLSCSRPPQNVKLGPFTL